MAAILEPPDLGPPDLESSEMRAALHGLRTRRRAQRLSNIDWIDTLYRAYVVGISLVAALATLAAIVGDAPVGRATLHDVRLAGPALAGALVAVLIALGLRSGTHGGPLAFEAADVQHVFLAPIDRGLVVRSAAYRQLRGVITAGVLAGALAGLTAGPRLGGRDVRTAAWIISGIAFGVAAALAAWGAALLASARGLTQRGAVAFGVILIAWSAVDAFAHTTTSPLSMLGHLAVWPIQTSWLVLGGIASVGAIVGIGFASARRLSLEPVLHRAQLVRALRFAATIQDVRAVITLRRQLAHEQSRTRPWIRLRQGARSGRPVWRRDWHGILRWPGARAARVVTLTVVAGASTAAALRGTTPLLAVAAIAAYVIALDAIEGLAQELDHPDRGSDLPIPSGRLLIAHLAVPIVLMGALAIVGVGAGVIVAMLLPAAGGVRSISPIVILAVALAVTITAPTAAAFSAYLGRPDRDFSVALMHPGVVVAQQVGPLVIVALAFIPLIVAREVQAPTDPVGSAVAATAPALVIAYGIGLFLRGRQAAAE